jgi:hypothetical protein
MFTKQYKSIIAVHNDEICWICGDQAAGGDRPYVRLTLEQVLDNGQPPLQMPEWLKGSHSPLCIIPDHWFGLESYPFQSKKPSLIEPFLERKLTTAFPGHEAIRHFYNYRHTAADGSANLLAVFFQEDKSYQLYIALSRLNHPPGHITSPAFLWEERLRQVVGDFGRQGTLLVHLAGRECQLYFYFNGNYQFSRNVMASDAAEDLDALGFEINQSLYMFSQKAKSELDRIYMLCDAPQCLTRLGQTLGREIIDLKTLAPPGPDPLIIPDMAPLNGLLDASHLNRRPRFFGVMHRQLQQAMQWRPVQWTGIILGLMLLLGLAGEGMVLGSMLDTARHAYRTQQQHMLAESSGIALSDYAATLDQVLGQARRSALADRVFRLPSGFPGQVRLKELDLELESAPSMKVTALVEARSADELQAVLSRLIAQLKKTFNSTRALTLNDIDITLDQAGDGRTANRYQIAFQLELT